MVTPCDWRISDGSYGGYRVCGRTDAHDHDSIGGTRHRRGFVSFETPPDVEVDRSGNLAR